MPVTPRTLPTGRVVDDYRCEGCGRPASYVDTSGKQPLAYCGMRDGKFCCVKGTGSP